MKLNLDYYNEELDKKEISEEYKEVFEKVSNHKGHDFFETLDVNSKIKNVFALSNIRENILNWYDFKENASILELNANYGEITGLLCTKAKRVVSIEESKKYADVIEKRYNNKDNLELIVGDFEKINLNEKFDYIVIIGITQKLQEALEYSKKLLKENGIILLTANNKFGVKAWITTKEEAKVVNNDKTAISKENLEKMLQGMYYKYYYPLPDYKLPNIIYTDKTLPTMANIYRDLTYKDGRVNFKEVDAYREIIKNNPEEFKIFANSFLLEISNESIQENNIRFITFSNNRKDEYRIKTVIKENEVYKTNTNSKSKKHIENIQENINLLNKIGIEILDSYQANKIVSRFSNSKTLEDECIEIIEKNGIDEFIIKIKEFEKFLKEKLQVVNYDDNNVFSKYGIKFDKEKLESLTFIKHGFWDLILQNCFVIDDKWFFYDQEWYEENVPVEFILYRVIIYFDGANQKYIDNDEIFKKLNITEFIPVFQELDYKLQEKIVDALIWNLHIKEELEINKYRNLKAKFEQKENEIIDLENEIKKLRIENTQKDSELYIIKTSLSWKITKPLRKIRKKMKKG